MSRWAALAGLGCLALALAYLPPQPRERPATAAESRSPERARYDRIGRAQSDVGELLRDVQFLDSVRRVVGDLRVEANGITVIVRGPLAESSRRQVHEAAARLWSRLVPFPDARVLVILDTKPARRPTYVLPAALDGRTCVASLFVNWSVEWLRVPTTSAAGSNLQPWLRDWIGPCLYYAAFGRPGPAIEAWLQARAFTPAYAPDWEATPPVLRLRDEPGAYNFLMSQVSFDALACGDGNLPRCRQGLLSPSSRESRLPHVAGLIRRRYWSLTFPAEERYLAALVHDMGRERFARFWRSTAPVDSAFLQAFGQPLDAWTARWTARFASDVPPFGPAPRPQAVLFSLALAAIAIAAAVGLVTRRQVG